ncbi:MAG: alpha-mannosidase [Ignavibacteriae bacterium]|nr:alpha-mannosidase [Ignavibacteriota bacterium]
MNVPLYTEILGHIKDHIYPNSVPLPHWRMKEGEVRDAALPSLNDKRWKDFYVTQHWGGYDKTVWFRQLVTVPANLAGRPLVLVVDLPEGLLFVNGVPHHGIDSNHREILLTQKATRNEKFHLAIQAYSGRKKQPSCFTSAFIAESNADARALYNALTTLQELETQLDPNGNERSKLQEILLQTIACFDSVSPESLTFRHAITQALDTLRKALSNSTVDRRGFVHLISQSHIDVVWLWTLKETERKCARTFSTALRLMDEFPEFNFSQSQPFLYQLTQKNYPTIYNNIKRRVKDGRWYPVGAMWVEPDCNIPNGESLVRQILYGKRFFKREFDIDADILWLPDTFGYSWALPQLMLKSGIKYFYTTKLTWNDTNKFPHNTFWWEGIDGSKVLAHIPPVGLEGQVAAAFLKKSWDAFQEKSRIEHTAQTFGFGDGGGGPTKHDVEATRVLTNAAGLPHSFISTMREFFETTARQATQLPTWRGELYLEMHRGTYSTHGWVKRANRQAESNLYATELLSTLAMVHGGKYPQQELEDAWKLLLLNQFHDIVPGTAIKDAYKDVCGDFTEINRRCETIQAKAFQKFVRRRSAGQSFVVFNSLSWTRSDYATVTVRSRKRSFTVVDREGNSVPSQIISRDKGVTTLLCHAQNIPPFSFKDIFVRPDEAEQRTETWNVAEKEIDSTFYLVKFNDNGEIRSMYDKVAKREIVRDGERANLFQTFRDMPERWEAWEIDPKYEQKQLTLFNFVGAKVIEQGPLRSRIRLRFAAASGSHISQDIMLYNHSRRIDFATRVHWQEKQTMLKVAFPLNISAERANYEIQFGALSHPTTPTSSWDKAKFEIPHQQWCDLSENGYGVSLLNDCKYGFDVKDSTLRLTLIRSPHYPHPVEPWWLHDEEATDQGSHEFTYALFPHEGDWRVGCSTQRARELSHPLLVVEGNLSHSIPPLFSLSPENIAVDSIKKAEDSEAIVVRLHEAHGVKTSATCSLGITPQSIKETNLLEEQPTELIMRDGHVTIDFNPYEIKTLIIAFSITD